MFAPATFVTALIMTILSTICWGSFANTYKLTKNYRFELYYWDYAGGIVLISLALAFTLGSSSGGEQSFLANLHSAAPMNMVDAGVGGFLFNIANVLLIAGIEMVGLAIAFPISIGIALVEGVVLSYIIQPKGSAFLFGPRRGHGGAGRHSDRQGLRRAAEREQKSAAERYRCVHHLGPADGHLRSLRHKVHDRRASPDALCGGGVVHIRSAVLLLLFQCVSDEKASRRRSCGLLRLLERAGLLPRSWFVGRRHLGPRDSLQFCRGQFGRRAHLIRHRAGVTDDCGVMGSSCLA